MSMPATSCSRKYTDNASTYCSRKRLMTIASRNDFRPRFSVYQLGRGSEPVTVVGMTLPAVAFSIWGSPNPKCYHVKDGDVQTQRSQRSQRKPLFGLLGDLCDLCVDRFLE